MEMTEERLCKPKNLSIEIMQSVREKHFKNKEMLSNW